MFYLLSSMIIGFDQGINPAQLWRETVLDYADEKNAELYAAEDRRQAWLCLVAEELDNGFILGVD
jgi:hypothetical protein